MDAIILEDRLKLAKAIAAKSEIIFIWVTGIDPNEFLEASRPLYDTMTKIHSTSDRQEANRLYKILAHEPDLIAKYPKEARVLGNWETQVLYKQAKPEIEEGYTVFLLHK